MEDYFKDFEYYGFESEFDMIKEFVAWGEDDPRKDEKKVKSLIEEWLNYVLPNEPGSLVNIPGNGVVADL
jgi:hypothetical protein